MGKTGQHLEGIAEDTQPGWFHMDGYPGISLDGRIIRWLGHVILKPLLNQSEDRKLWRKRPLDYAFAAFTKVHAQKFVSPPWILPSKILLQRMLQGISAKPLQRRWDKLSGMHLRKELLNSLKKTPYTSAFPYYIWAT